MSTPTTFTPTDDLLLEILSKLPLNSLSRFQCVSKSWHDIISHECLRLLGHPLTFSAIINNASNRRPRHGSIIIIDDKNIASSSSLSSSSTPPAFKPCDMSFFPAHEISDLVDCCNGLLLFASWYPAGFHVCNPATEKWADLPEARNPAQLSVLAFDPTRSPHYKVACFTGWRAGGAQLEVYSSETGCWADQVVEWAGLDTDAMSATMRYFDGALHVLAHPHYVVRVDLEAMTCRLIELPDSVSREGRMGLCCGRMYYAAAAACSCNNNNNNNNGCHGEEIKVWVMEKGCNNNYNYNDRKWLMLSCIAINNNGEGFDVLGLHPEREVVYVWFPGKVVGYDLRSKEVIEEVCVFEGEMEGAYLMQMWLVPSSSRYLLDCL